MTVNPYRPEKCKIIKIKKQTAVDSTFTVEAHINPSPGQFVEVSLPKVGECPISVSDFSPGVLEMTIRRVGRVTGAIHGLREGDYLFIRGPYGNGFPMESLAGKQVIVAAGGTGLAPVKSVLNYYYRHMEEIKGLDLLAGFKTPSDILFSPDLERWAQKFNVQVTVDRGDTGWQGRVGLITELIKEMKISRPEDTAAIVVGPPLMIKFACQEFQARRIDINSIWISMERRMNCGLGKCGHCKINDAYVCLDGPVFNLSGTGKLVD